MKKSYPLSLFIIGFVLNLLSKLSFIFFPSIILLIIGILFKPCIYVGLVLLILFFIISMIYQLRIRKTFMALANSDDADLIAFEEAVTGENNWREGIKSFVEQRINEFNEDEQE